MQIDDRTYAVLVCSDGAGSASLSQVGARVACDRFFDLVYESLRSGTSLEAIDREQNLRWYLDVQQSIRDEAARRDTSPRNLACTLLTAVVGEGRAIFAQVGDGTIVRRIGDGYESVFWPQRGDYANVTNFVTQDDIGSVFEFAAEASSVDELALLTDGLQRLVLDFTKRSVHQAFFRPFFSALRSAEHADELVAPLRAFLDSTSVNERTDDDKTLVLASRFREPPAAG